MATFVQAVRFSVGLAMVAGGAVLVAPVAYDVAGRAHELAPRAAPDAGGAAVAPPPAHTIPDPRGGEPRHGFAPPPEPAAPSMPSEPYRAPPPPPPLPAVLPGVVNGAEAGGTGLDGTYRSTLRVPPPPLLDVAGPPPVAPGWTTHEPMRQVAAPSIRGAIPQSYTVRDGDDLTALAVRFYGHPGAAAAILEANRDVLVRPDMLPIGVALRLPPPWTIGAVRPAGGPQTIEPGPAVDRGRPADTGRSPFAPAAAPRSWLDRPST